MEHPPADFPETTIEQQDVRGQEYCSAVLRYFQSRSTRVATVDELATFIHRRERPDEDETRIESRLHHATLPRLADAGLVDYDARSNTARYRGHPS